MRYHILRFDIFPYFFPPREKKQKEKEETEAEDIKML